MLTPYQDRVLVELIPEEVRKGVIIRAPEGDARCLDGKGGDYRRNCIEARVLAVGPGKWREEQDGNLYFYPVEVRLGDVVYCTQWNDLDEYLPRNQALIMEGDIYGTKRQGNRSETSRPRSTVRSGRRQNYQRAAQDGRANP